MKKMKKIIIISIVVILLLVVTAFIFIIYGNQRIPVLAYHNMAPREERNKYTKDNFWTVEAEKFDKEMKFLKDNHFKTLTMQEFYDWKKGKIELPRKSVLITFDDGYYSNYKYAFPILKKYGLNATVFVIGAMLPDKQDSYKEGTPPTDEYIAHDTLEKIKTEYPNIEICSHSFNLHESEGGLKDKSYDWLMEDMRNFKENIGETPYFAYPRGVYNDTIIQALKDSGYKMAFLFGEEKKDGKEKSFEKASRSDDDYKIPRLNISNKMDLNRFELRMLLPF